MLPVFLDNWIPDLERLTFNPNITIAKSNQKTPKRLAETESSNLWWQFNFIALKTHVLIQLGNWNFEV